MKEVVTPEMRNVSTLLVYWIDIKYLAYVIPTFKKNTNWHDVLKI